MDTINNPALSFDNNQPATPVRDYTQLSFHGDSKEFFSIWIVNLLLSIVTLGIYSAWAKVRTNRYFYANLEADGHRFSYLAQPKQVLRGRILAIVFFIAYSVIASINPTAGLVMMVLMMFLSPWIICQSFKFAMKMTSYRNVRFGFTGTYGKAFRAFILYPILSLFTLNLALPLAIKEMDRFVYSNITYGNKKVNVELDGGFYWVTSFISGLMTIGLFAGLGVIVFLIGANTDVAKNGATAALATQLVVMAGYLFAYVAGGAYYTSRIRNHIFNNLEIDGVAKFSSDIDFGQLIWLRLSNLLALVGSLGLAYPWVKVRTFGFMAEATEVLVSEAADQVLSAPTDDSTAFGEETADIFDFDLALV